jgi:hypothetical protein
MAARRHHTVTRFLLDRFARDTDKGRLVCQLDKTLGATKQISPRDATIVKDFYSVETDDGLDPAVENALADIEGATAPLIASLAKVGPDGLAERPELPLHERARLALFIAISRVRTPIWWEQTKSIAEQFVTYTKAERLDHIPGPFTTEERGDGSVVMPKNALIQHALGTCGHGAWMLCLLDWMFVRPNSVPFIVGDTPVSVFDPTPKFPGSAGGPLSSPNSELFMPFDPRLGLLMKPNPEKMTATWDAVDALVPMTDEERLAYVAEREGVVAEAIIEEADAEELNLRTYAHAQRFVYGSQHAVCDTHRTAKANRSRLAVLAPAPPRLHILEDDPTKPAVMRAVKVFAATTELPRRRRRAG